jgi:hypothetical protein
VIPVRSAAGETVEMQNRSQAVIVDGSVGPTPPAEAARPQDTGRTSHGGTPFASAAVDVQLQRVESRLIALARGDATLEGDVRSYLAQSCARFATAPVRQYVPILVEREVRDRLRARNQAGAEQERTA